MYDVRRKNVVDNASIESEGWLNVVSKVSADLAKCDTETLVDSFSESTYAHYVPI